MNEPLLPCPFCGGPARLSNDGECVVVCADDECAAVGPFCTDYLEAVREWNERRGAPTTLEAVTPARPTAETSRDPLLKRPTWFFSMESDGDPISCLGDDVPHALSIIRDQIEGDMTLIFDGDVATYQLKRIDMSDVEVEALPEI